MTRFISTLAIALAALTIPLAPLGHLAHASQGNNNPQTVALRRQSCTAATTGPQVGTARFAFDDQGGNPGGLEIDIALAAGLPRTTYSVSVLSNPCQVLVSGGTLQTDDRGRGDLSLHVPGAVVPPGANLRVQLVAPANADVLTSDLAGPF